MDDIEKRMEEIRATAESIDSGGVSEGVDPQASIYRKDVIWLLTQLTASRQECERLRCWRDCVLASCEEMQALYGDGEEALDRLCRYIREINCG